MAGYVACHHDDVFDHCADPPPFYRMFHWMVRPNAFAADHTQNVIGKHRKLQHKLVRIEEAFSLTDSGIRKAL